MLRWKVKQDTPPNYFGDRLKSLWWQDEEQQKCAEAEAEQYRDPRELIEAEAAPIEVVKTEKEETEAPIEVVKTEKEETEAPSEVEETAEEEIEAPSEVEKTAEEEQSAELVPPKAKNGFVHGSVLPLPRFKKPKVEEPKNATMQLAIVDDVKPGIDEMDTQPMEEDCELEAASIEEPQDMPEPLIQRLSKLKLKRSTKPLIPAWKPLIPAWKEPKEEKCTNEEQWKSAKGAPKVQFPEYEMEKCTNEDCSYCQHSNPVWTAKFGPYCCRACMEQHSGTLTAAKIALLKLREHDDEMGISHKFHGKKCEKNPWL
jgi:hypothetical protein